MSPTCSSDIVTVFPVWSFTLAVDGKHARLVVAGLLFYIDVVDAHNIYRILGCILSDIPKVARQVFQNNNKLYPFDTSPNNIA